MAFRSRRDPSAAGPAARAHAWSRRGSIRPEWPAPGAVSFRHAARPGNRPRNSWAKHGGDSLRHSTTTLRAKDPAEGAHQDPEAQMPLDHPALMDVVGLGARARAEAGTRNRRAI